MPSIVEGASAVSGKRLVYICDWLPPDFGAVGQYSVLFARDLARAGRDVTLIGLTSHEASVTIEPSERGAFRIVKVPVSAYDKTKTGSRILWTIKTNTRLLLAALPYIRKAQSVLFTGSPPLFLHWIAPVNVLLGKELVYRITDFHPECAIAERGSASLFQKLVLALTLFWRRRVRKFEVLGYDQAQRLKEIGIPRERIVLKRDPSPVEIDPRTAPLARPTQAGDKFLLLYSGNWGIAHDTSTFVPAYIAHHKRGPGTVLLWLNAVGKGAAEVASALDAAGVPYIKTDLVPLDRLPSLLRTPDAHLITLKNPFVGYVLPSKVYACIDSGFPVIFVGPAASDVHALCSERKSGSYFHVDVGDIDRCTRLLDELGARRNTSSAKQMRLVRSSV